MTRKVVRRREPEETVELGNVSDEKYYGFFFTPGKRGFIQQTGYRKGPFKASALEGITHGNSFRCGYEGADASLSGLLESLMDRGFQVREFDTHRELALWLAQMPGAEA
jgi:hypothetical protein